jgi:S-DNA-T family DNA segregation ATPase FtsK/SpoIIIE
LKRSALEWTGWALAAISLVALPLLVLDFGLGAPLLRILFGWGAFLFIPSLLLAGLSLAFSERRGWRVRWPAILALEALFVGILALAHAGAQFGLADAMLGRRGGLVGWGVTEALRIFLPDPVVWLLLSALIFGALAALALAVPPQWISQARAAAATAWARLTGRRASPALEPVVEQIVPPVPPSKSASKDLSRRRRPKAAPSARRPDWLPPLDLLKPDPALSGASANSAHSANARQRAQLIKQTLADFGVPVEVVSIKEGPTVTQFGLEPGEIVKERDGEVIRRRVSVQSILRLRDDLALELAAASLRIEAPVPGRPYVGIEVPNSAKTLVSLRGVLESETFLTASSPLAVALGRDVSGDPVIADLAKMPHLLIAGATGSGKSVCVNAIVCSLLMSNGPETVRFVMVDPKMVELPGYNGIPHLLGPVITDPNHAAAALAWLMLQMDDRYRLFSEAGVRNVEDYNRKARKAHDLRPLPYLVLIIDELADLMMTSANDVESQLVRLGQMARATGIHLVLATQRPSVDVITGLIKANFPARIAFAVTTQIDSRVILDVPGAEKLLGRGDMLFMAPDASKLSRIQGCFVSDREIEKVVEFWLTRPDGEGEAVGEEAPWAGLVGNEQTDQLLHQALKLISTRTHVSTSLLQRQLRIGFPRAARLMDQLEEMGAVASDEGGGRSREVLYRPESAEDAIL